MCEISKQIELDTSDFKKIHQIVSMIPLTPECPTSLAINRVRTARTIVQRLKSLKKTNRIDSMNQTYQDLLEYADSANAILQAAHNATDEKKKELILEKEGEWFLNIVSMINKHQKELLCLRKDPVVTYAKLEYIE